MLSNTQRMLKAPIVESIMIWDIPVCAYAKVCPVFVLLSLVITII